MGHSFFSKLSLKKSGTDLNKSEDDEDLPEATDASIREMNSPELAYNIIGVIVALAVGGVQPLFAIMFSEILRKYSIHFFKFIVNSYVSQFYLLGFQLYSSDLSKTKAHLVNTRVLIILISKKRLKRI